MQTFRETEFVIFDVETTGLSPHRGDRMIEIAGLKIRDLRPVDQFHSLIDPKREISYGAFRVNGISREMLAGAPEAGDVIPAFLDFLGGACLVGHNIQFDINFLQNELSLIGSTFDPDRLMIDTIGLARRFLPDLGSYALRHVAYALAIDQEQLHRAMSDVELTFQVFRHLLEMADRRDISYVEELFDRSRY